MPLDTCIDNVGEYYSAHYLDSTLHKDTKPTLDRWRERGSDAPPRRVAGLSDLYFTAKDEALDDPDRETLPKELAEWHPRLLAALGYHDLAPLAHPVEGESLAVPLLALYRRFGRLWLAIAEAPFILPSSSTDSATDPLEAKPTGRSELLLPESWEKALLYLFTEDDAPRWTLFLAGSAVYLFDRNTFAQGRYLRFDLDDAFARREAKTFELIALFLSKETLCPDAESGEVLHDTIEQQSHKFAYGVSEALQGAVREAIELIANEWIDYRRLKKYSFTERQPAEMRPGLRKEITPEDLRHEALVYVYRLLFCFYAEARGGELGILPIGDATYRTGYSLEALRELELVPLSPEAAEGTYFHEHLSKLFGIIHKGFPEHEEAGTAPGLFASATVTKGFQVLPLTATLFDPDALPLLSRAVLRNSCLQRVIRALSLVRDERSRTRGRVNYAELGINQLGAVYEGLLSYKGMRAKENLIQVKRKGEDPTDPKTQTWFVPEARLGEFEEDEVVRLPGNGAPRIYREGTFVLHLNGIDRQKSASYYTPEPLTRCLVEEALRELLKDYKPEDADKILELKICEPAMGSGAFLNEAAAQLAHRYLELKKEATKEPLDPARYNDEHRRVRHYIAVNNIYGVDLNETAVELGALSLWLGSMHRLFIPDPDNAGKDSFQVGATPWFGLRLRAGNSLIGARRAVWTRQEIKDGKFCGKEAVPPRQLKPGEERGKDEVYHFLLFDEDMVAAAREKFLRTQWKDECERANEWRKREVTKKYSEQQLTKLVLLSEMVDVHLRKYGEERLEALQKTACTASVWPTPSDSAEALRPGPRLHAQEEVKRTLEKNSGSYQRLKLVMDSWCALWFWSVVPGEGGETVALPTREAWLAACEMVLTGESPDESVMALMSIAVDFPVQVIFGAAQGEALDVERIAAVLAWVEEAQKIAGEQRFFHWEIEFPEVLVFGRGFDLVVGNPPWVGADRDEAAILAELEPILGVREARRGELVEYRSRIASDQKGAASYAREITSALSEQAALGSVRYFKELRGGRTNLYKNFIVRAVQILSPAGTAGLLHPDGLFDETNAMALRQAYLPRLRWRLQFRNELGWFPIGNTRRFGVHIFSGERSSIRFQAIFNLFHPSTISSCRDHRNACNPLPGLKSDCGDWDLRGHPDRIVEVDEQLLQSLSLDSDSAQQPEVNGQGQESDSAAPLAQFHSREIVGVVKKLLQGQWVGTTDYRPFVYIFFNESTSTELGQIRREEKPSYQPTVADECILTGPLFFVGTPFYQTAKSRCTTNRAFDPIDLTTLPKDFLPRTVYRPGNSKGDLSAFESITKSIGLNGPLQRQVAKDYRFAFRTMCLPSTERTLIGAVMPPGITGIHGVTFAVSKTPFQTLVCAGTFCSIVSDFLLRVRGRTNIYEADLALLPAVPPLFQPAVVARMLRLSCLTEDYSQLWTEIAGPWLQEERFCSTDPRLESDVETAWPELSPKRWNRQSALRTDFSRRQALIEIDVLIALAAGISLKELLTMYNVQFSVLKAYDKADRYDQQGRRIPNTTRRNPGATEIRAALIDHDDASPITVSWPIDDGRQTVTKTFFPPFTPVDRQADYARAYEVFTKRLGL